MDFVVEIAPNSDECSVGHRLIGLREGGLGLVDLEPNPGPDPGLAASLEIGIVAADLADLVDLVDLFATPAVAGDLAADPEVLSVPVVD